MKYSLGCNFDEGLLDYLEERDTKHQIESLFGKLKKDIIGGGRASNILPDLSMSDLGKYVGRCKKIGIGFNYLLNPMCLGNREVIPSEHKQIVRFIGKLQDIGINHVTINSPYLCEIIKKQFPGMKITIGLYAYIFTLQHARFWLNLGADELTLQHRVNRDFSTLKTMLSYFKDTNLKLRVIANNVCLHECPYQVNHGNGQAHASQSKDEEKSIFLDYSLMKCTYNKIRNPSALIAAEWIRPEDVKYYTQLCDETGNHNFSIKLLERTKTSKFLKRVVDAYLSEDYDGNLLDILTWASSKNTMNVDYKAIFYRAAKNTYNLGGVKSYAKVFEVPQISINNKKLNGFLEYFTSSYNCDKIICGATTPPDNASDKKFICDYCNKWAENSIDYVKEQVEGWLHEYENVLDMMNDSSMFHRL